MNTQDALNELLIVADYLEHVRDSLSSAGCQMVANKVKDARDSLYLATLPQRREIDAV